MGLFGMMKEARLKRLEERKNVISGILKAYAEPVKYGKQSYAPDNKEIEEYRCVLEKMSDKDLTRHTIIYEAGKKERLAMKLKKLNKKKSFVVTIYRKNQSRTHYNRE